MICDSAPVDIGSRLELFVDDCLIDEMRGVALRLQRPQPAETVLAFDKPWEGPFTGSLTVLKDGGKYRLYYFGFPMWPTLKHLRCLCMAESDDGVHFTRPHIGLHERDGSRANNIVHPIEPETKRYILMPFLDTRPGVPPEERYKGVGGNYHGGGLFGWTSPDGIHWQRLADRPITDLGPLDSENVAFWSKHEGCYVCYFRTWYKRNAAGQRGILQRTPDGQDWHVKGVDENGKPWTLPLDGGFENDGIRWVRRSTSPDFRHWSESVEMDAGDAPDEHIYTCLPYPYFRAPHIYIAPGARFVRDRKVLSDSSADAMDLLPQFLDRSTDAVLMSSRGGAALDRTFLESWIRPGMEPEDWIYGSNFPSGVVQTGTAELSLYVNMHFTRPSVHARRYTLRLDGFASVHAGHTGGEMTTKPLRFEGDRLVLNYSTSAAGSIRVGLENEAGVPIPGHTLADGIELVGNTVAGEVSWRNGPDVAPLTGKTIRLRFAMQDADIFSYRFAPALRGERAYTR